jgi:hypothetical protein
MNPKEKADEIYNSFYQRVADGGYPEDNAKECALIAVDEIINCDSFFKTLESVREFTAYWYEVQNEINKL